jgi:hypothetical protein
MHEIPSEIGARAERAVANALLEAGWHVYVPLFAPHTRVDLVAIRHGVTLRIQCKNARLYGNIVEFRTCSNTKNVLRSYDGEVDAFGVYCPDLGATYLVPLEGLGGRGCYLRLAPTANNQARGVRYAADYEIRAVALSESQ